MVKETLKENSEIEDKKEEEDEDDNDEVEKSVNTVLDQLQSIVDSQQSLIETQKAIGETIIDLADRVKAMEKPTDLPLKPKESDGEDIGAEVKIPTDVYASESEQASLRDDGKGTSNDKIKLTKSTFNFTTETPRPNASLEIVNKSYSQDFSPILKDARELGYEGLSQVAMNILKGKYYVPSEQEVGY